MDHCYWRWGYLWLVLEKSFKDLNELKKWEGIEVEMIRPHIENHDTIYKAAVNCDEELALKTLINDPLVKEKLTQKKAQVFFKI